MLRDAAPERRLLQAAALSRAVRDMALAGLRSRHPGASPAEIRRRLGALVLGPSARHVGEVQFDAEEGPPVDDDLVAVVVEVAQALERTGAAYAIGGSFASSLHGLPRATNDVDLVADVRPVHVEALVAELGGDFYIEPDVVRAAVAAGTSFNIIHHRTLFKVDVFVKGTDAFRSVQVARAKAQAVRGASLRVLSPEDVILAKLLWYRDGAGVSDRQWRDALDVFAVQGERLDMAYLRAAARDMGLEDLLNRVLSEAGL